MTDIDLNPGRKWRYRFSQPGGTEIETRELKDDAAADSWAHDLSKSNDTPVIIHRYEVFVDDWTYVTEVDDRS